MCSGNVATAAIFNQLQLIFLKFSHVDLRFLAKHLHLIHTHSVLTGIDTQTTVVSTRGFPTAVFPMAVKSPISPVSPVSHRSSSIGLALFPETGDLPRLPAPADDPPRLELGSEQRGTLDQKHGGHGGPVKHGKTVKLY